MPGNRKPASDIKSCGSDHGGRTNIVCSKLDKMVNLQISYVFADYYQIYVQRTF